MATIDYGYPLPGGPADCSTVQPCIIPNWTHGTSPLRPHFTPTVTITLAEYEDLKLERDTLLKDRDSLIACVNEQAERIALALCTLDPWDDEDDEEDDDEGDEV